MPDCLFVATSTRIHYIVNYSCYHIFSEVFYIDLVSIPTPAHSGVDIWHLGSVLVTPTGYIKLSTAGIRQRQ